MSEIKLFFEKIEKPHRRINPCFMTGKGCVSTEAIDRIIDSRRRKGQYTGFLIVPFRPNISTFFDLCLSRYLKAHYQLPSLVKDEEALKIIRADQIWRTGYVICEKICRKIQDSDFVIADISIPNPNVFYELGLAFGANQKIVVVYHGDSVFGQQSAKLLKDGGCQAYPYQNLNPLEEKDFPLSQYLWQQEMSPRGMPPDKPKILFFEHLMGNDPSIHSSEDSLTDISLSFKTHVMAAVGVAIENIVSRIPGSTVGRLIKNYEQEIRKMKSVEIIDENENFTTVISRIQEAFCMIIRTGEGCNPMSYFWLGYCHALGKNVIPITVVDNFGDDIKDLAFDVRALWHMTFARNKADTFAAELEETLYQMVINDFAEWSRQGFWNEMLTRRGKVSIFAGALHNYDIGREMIGDWDLRAASELTSFFAMHQYRAVIESPVYQIEFVEKNLSVPRERYLKDLQKQLEDKNCVIIASPDVSPLTEFVLGRVYGIPEKYWFTNKNYPKKPSYAIVAVKAQTQITGTNESDKNRSLAFQRFFYGEIPAVDKTNPQKVRGFEASYLTQGKISGSFLSQTDKPDEFTVHAHLLIAENPFQSDRSSSSVEPRYLIILNGVSGPATFALTHVLTGGGVSTEFEAYSEDFDREAESENVLQRLLQEWSTAKQGKRSALQCILSVTVGPAQDILSESEQSATSEIFDWRRIRRWSLLADTLCSFKIEPFVACPTTDQRMHRTEKTDSSTRNSGN